MQSNKQLSTSLFEHSQTYDLTFKDISYEVVHGKKKTILEILHSVSGSAPIGEVTGILGPSGAGKTTLLNILSWRNYGKVYGEILLNGKPRLKNQKKRIGYVMQKDYFFAELSIEETLRYTALLRRGGGKNHQEINVMVKEVISMMGLERCAQTLLGDPFVRGISGGELKRVNIGNELLVDPSILFLDEPTSGLDSTSAVAVLRILRRVAQTYLKTVVLSIHQPSSMAFLMLDKVICMTNGHIIYQGPSLELADYLGVIGYPLPLGWNVADHVMDLLCDASMVDSLLTAYRHYLCMDASTGRYFMGFKESPQLSLASTNNSQSGTIPTSSEEPLSVGEEISSQKLPSLTEVRIENAPLHEEGENITKETSHLKEKKENSSKASMNTSDAPNMLRLIFILLQRSLRKDFKGIVTGLNISQAAFVGIITGLLWFQLLARRNINEFQDRLGFFFFAAAFWTFVPAFSALSNFPNERVVIAKERSSKMYPISAYLFSKTFSDVVILLIAPLVWFVIVVSFIGLSVDSQLLIILLGLMTNVFVSHAVGMVVSTMVSGFRAGAVVLSVFLLTCMLSSGFYVNHTNLTSWITWIKWISMQYYSTSIFLQANSHNLYFTCSGEPITSSCRVAALNLYSPFFTGFSIFANFGFLILYWSGCKFITYLLLRFGNQLKLQG